MATVTFLVHPDRPDALALANDTAAWLKGRGDRARILRFSGPDRVDDDGVERALGMVDLAGSTVAVSLGGDGTFLRIVRMATGTDVPVLGVNFGRLGYLPDLGPDQIRGALRKVFEGQATIESRCALEVAIADRSLSNDTSLLALNEVVIEKIDFGHTVRLATRIDGEEALTYSADGLIVATPTGSTAYNLSAGGPILAPTLRCMVVTPVAPHLSLDRSLVLSEDQEVRIEVVPDRAGALVIDGADVGRLQPGSVVTCRIAAKPVRVVRNEPQTFGEFSASACWPTGRRARNDVLSELRVRDLGVIEDLTLSFGPGMTVLTGETGAGKTLVVEALQLVLGGRADVGMVRSGATEALVEARFVVDEGGDGGEGTEVILARSVPAEGRARTWIDGRMASVRTLAETAAALVEIHGQHEHRTLVTPSAQRDVLDAFAGTDLSRIRSLRSQLRALDDSLAALGGDDEQRAREADVLRYQVHEIAVAQLDDAHEEQALRLEEERLADAGAFRENGLLATDLVGGDGGALDLLGRAGTALAGREGFEAARARIVSAAVELADVSRSLRDEVEGWEDDPNRLAEVQERRRLLAELRRKYGEDLAAVMAYGASAAARLGALEDAEGEAARLQAEQAARLTELAEAEAEVRATRAAAAGAFGQRVAAHLGDLAMGGARLEVEVAAGGTGEPVELLLGANVGEPVQSLAKAASGGELARAMLAIRLVELGGPQTMVFDEVDAGVGGAAALALGEALHEVGRHRQVLVVTHLAQVAAQADAQISVVKRASKGRTVTTAAAVDGEERVTELSRMLSGHPGSDAARAHARELLDVTSG